MPLTSFHPGWIGACCVICLLYFPPSNVLAQSKIDFKGQVIDFDTRAPIAGVTVSLQPTGKNTITDEKGMFAFQLDVDSYSLLFTMIGYRPLLRPIFVLDTTYITVELKKRAPTELPEVTVLTTKKDANVSEAKMSTVNINLAQLRKTPILFGEADLLKALQLQTGISTIGEGAGGFSVRGGNADQNLILLDGAPLFNTSHLLGFFSSVSPEAVQDFTLHKGAIPASFGGRLSSFVALNIRPGNPDTLRYGFSINPVSLHFFAEGPVKKQKLTFSGDARVAFPKYIINQLPGSTSESNAFFYDVTGKMVYHFNDRNQVGISLYRSYDLYKFPGDTSYTWQSDVAALNGRSELSHTLSLYYSGNISYNASNINGLEPNYQFTIKSFIENQEAKISLHYQAAEKVYTEWGGDYIHYIVSPGMLRPTNPQSKIDPLDLRQEYGNELAGYGLVRYELSSLLSLEAGLRYSGFQYLGPNTIYEYAPGVAPSPETVIDSISYPRHKTIASYSGWEPRILMKIGIDERTSIKLSYIKTQQFLQLVTNTTAITPVDFWKLSDPMIPPASADQWAAGIFKNFKDNMFEGSIEGYYKRSVNLLDYANGASLSMNPQIDADLLSAKGKSYGIELNAKKTKGTITGQLAFTWSRSLIADVATYASQTVNGGAYYPSNYDRPINLALTGGYKMGQGWELGTTFVFLSGRPTTYPDGDYLINGTVVSNYSLRNEDRLPDYNRLDVSFAYDSRRYSGQKKYYIFNFSIYNVYARQNAYSIYFQRNGGVLDAYQLSVFGTIIPSCTLTYYF
jgi:CarboxypepD_reg-like domain/TonB-dependent Receptor Plug Domain